MTKTIHVRNFAGIKEVTLHPTGSLVVIAGSNGAGKSSILNAVAEIFNSKGVKLFPKPIREGADEAYAEYIDEELGMKFARTWKKDDAGKLEVTSLDGARYSKPSEIIAKLTGGLLFDPLEFLNLPEKAQRNALLEKVDLPFDLDALAREQAGAEERRLVAGREVKRLEGAESQLAQPDPGVPDEEVSASAILTEISEAQDAHRRFEDARRDHDDAAADVQDLAAKIARLQEQLVAAKERESEAYRVMQSMPTPPDIAPIQARLTELDETNKAIRAARQYWEVTGQLQVADDAHAAAQAELDAIAQKKADGLAQAVFPVAGLSVDDEGVTFNGIPFGQVNTAARMRVAFAIATAGDPKLKLTIVKNGDLLDAESLQALADLAEERGYTVLVERDRDESRAMGFTVTDGVLAEVAA